MAALRRVENPPNPFQSQSIEWAPDDAAPEVRLEVFEEHARSVVTENKSPDVGFRFSVNPYRGCFHACAYCYARPTHQYLDFGAGTDFDRKIVVKVNAPALLEARLARRSWPGAPIVFSGNTDCYQPLEATYGLTRACLEVCLRHENPASIITKGYVIRRDVALLARLGERASCRVTISLAFSDDAMRRVFDPYAAPVDARFATIRMLADAGVDVGIALAPIIPGVNDAMIPEIVSRAADAGAKHAFMTLVRLAPEVREVFEARVREALPLRAEKILSGIRALRGGAAMNDSRFGHRMVGQGARWAAIQSLFDQAVRRHGLDTDEMTDDLGPRPPARTSRSKRQLDLL